MFELKKVLPRMLPKKTKDISISILCIQEIYEYMLFDKDTTRSFERLGVGLSNVLKLCQDSLKLAKKNDLDTLLQALAFIKVRLYDVSNNAKLARQKINLIMNRIDGMITD